MDSSISDLEVADIVPALRSVYVGTDGINHKLAVDQLLTRIDNNRPTNPEWYRSVFIQLDDRSRCSFAVGKFETLLTSLEDHDLPTGQAVRLATVTASAIVLADATLQYPHLNRSAATRAINDAIKRNLAQKAVANAGHRTLKIGEAIAYGAAITQQLTMFPHPEDSRTEFEGRIEECLEDGSFESIEVMYKKLNERQNEAWTKADLLEFSPHEFEELLATCWSVFHNAAVTTQGSHDRGIDLIVRTDSGKQLAVQAKRYVQSNTVGIGTVQRTAGLTKEFDIDRSVLVTSSEFTRQAKESATSIDEITIVDGKELCSWLNCSSLAPPFNATRK